ncbi:MAG: DUF4136 domain-containing protein [Ekhidna sp.]
MKKCSLLIIVFIVSCNPKVVSFVNPKSKFGHFETYRLVSAQADSKNVTSGNTPVFDLIKQNIHNEMARRSYKLSSVSPDLTLRYEVTSSTRVETERNQFDSYYNTQVSSRAIYESALIVELVDQKKKLVWQGSYDLSQQRKEKKISAAIEKAVGHIFTSYPYRALSAKEDESLKTFVSKKKDSK